MEKFKQQFRVVGERGYASSHANSIPETSQMMLGRFSIINEVCMGSLC